jgi:hypothetical protein
MVVFHIGRVLLSLAEVTKGINFREMPMIGGFGMMAILLSILSKARSFWPWRTSQAF